MTRHTKVFGTPIITVSSIPIVSIVLSTAFLVLSPPVLAQVPQSLLDINLIRNPGAEIGLGGNRCRDFNNEVPDWEDGGPAAVHRYGTDFDFPSSGQGTQFFAGGWANGFSSLRQVIDVSQEAARIDAGLLIAALAGSFGGFSTQDDYAYIEATFQTSAGAPLGRRLRVEPVTKDDRDSRTVLLERSTEGSVPPGTRRIDVQLFFDRFDGTCNNGYADDLRLVLRSICPEGVLETLYDSGGFESFTLGFLGFPQDGWAGSAITDGIHPEVLEVGGNKKIQLAVPSGEPPLDHRKESRVVKTFSPSIHLESLACLDIELTLRTDADANGVRQNFYFDFDPEPNKFLPSPQIVSDQGRVWMLRGGNQIRVPGTGNGTFGMRWVFDLTTSSAWTTFGLERVDAPSPIALSTLIGNQPGEDPDDDPQTLDALSFAMVSDILTGPMDAAHIDDVRVIAIRRPPCTASSCDDFNDCTDDLCDPASGVCSNPTKPDGSTCDDGIACTTGDACFHGVCVGSDTEDPVISCPPGTLVPNDPGQCSASVDPGTATATDNCPGVSAACVRSDGQPLSAPYPVGSTTITCTATDTSGRTGVCQQVIVVNDTQLPFISCPAGIVVANDPGQCSASVDPGTATATDNCPGVSTASVRSDGQPLSAPYPVGSTTITWTATDTSGGTSPCQQSLVVNDTQPPFISNASTNPVVLWPPNHTLRDLTVDYSMSDNCGSVTCALSVASNESIDGTGDGDSSPDWIVLDAHRVQLRAERAGTGNGRTYTTSIGCVDSTGNASGASTTVLVKHDMSSPKSGSAFRIGSSVSFAGSFWDVPGRTHTAQWLFDSLSSTGTVTEPTATKPGSVGGIYTFTSTGVYDVKMNVKDTGGATGTADTVDGVNALVVIYDPNGGYVTGGGWFDSPPGAYRADAGLTGKVNFGFVSKYFKNATNPKGETELDFRLAGLKFNALNFAYLMISGAKAMYKGFGKVNGDAGYNFILTVVDGQASGGDGIDKFRMKIWNKSTGAIVYDNQLGAPDSADPITPVGAGSSIVIQP